MAHAGDVSTTKAERREPRLGSYHLQVSRYDRVASMLLSLLVLIGITVLMLAVIWLTNQIFTGQAVVPIQLEEIGTGDDVLREGPELDEPTPEEIREEIDLTEPQLGDTLAAISTMVSNNVSMLDDPSLNRSLRPGGRMVGGGRPGRARRWEVRFPKGSTLEAYGKQLDAFGIELGVLLPNNEVGYAFNLSQSKPSKRTGPADEEKRYYLTWQRGELQAADRELLERSGLSAEKRIIVKFLPPELEAKLVAMEKAKAGPEYENVRSTRFGVRPAGSGYEFYLIDQTYQWGKRKKP